MARPRLMTHAKHSAPVCRSYTALVVWPLHRLGLAAACQRAIRAARTRALSVAVATPVILVGAAGAAAPQIQSRTPALRSTAISPVAAVTGAGTGPSCQA